MMKQEIRVSGAMCSAKPDYSLAWLLRESIEKFYEDPENERAFREWEKKYDEKRKGA